MSPERTLKKWSGWRDSNPRPLRPERSALARLRYTPMPNLAGKKEGPKIGEIAPEVNGASLTRDALTQCLNGETFGEGEAIRSTHSNLCQDTRTLTSEAKAAVYFADPLAGS
jgi:hypothetical protein